MQKEEGRELQESNIVEDFPPSSEQVLSEPAEKLVELVMTDPQRYTVGEVYETLQSQAGEEVSEDELRKQMARIMEKVERSLEQTKDITGGMPC